MITDFRYLGKLHLDWDVNERPDHFKVREHWCVEFVKDGVKIDFVVGTGTWTDLASIPTVVPKWVAKKVDLYLGAAVVHDHLCVLKLWTSGVAADVYEAAMMEAEKRLTWPEMTLGDKVHRTRMRNKRRIMVRAVRWFGPSWK